MVSKIRSLKWFTICCLIAMSTALSGCVFDTLDFAADEAIKSQGFTQVELWGTTYNCNDTSFKSVIFAATDNYNQRFIGQLCMRKIERYWGFQHPVSHDFFIRKI